MVFLLTSIAYGQVIEDWVAVYDGPGHLHDWAISVAMDSVGNVYVTGYSNGGSTLYDYCTIKYDSLGTELWVSEYNGPGDYIDCALFLAIDAGRNIYFTGYSHGAGSHNTGQWLV